jgi:hypothetical protein
MAKRTKTRIDHLADALVEMQHSLEVLQGIDLRSCRAPLRQHIKESREQLAAAIEQTAAAMKADVPDVARVTAEARQKV